MANQNSQAGSIFTIPFVTTVTPTIIKAAVSGRLISVVGYGLNIVTPPSSANASIYGAFIDQASGLEVSPRIILSYLLNDATGAHTGNIQVPLPMVPIIAGERPMPLFTLPAGSGLNLGLSEAVAGGVSGFVQYVVLSA